MRQKKKLFVAQKWNLCEIFKGLISGTKTLHFPAVNVSIRSQFIRSPGDCLPVQVLVNVFLERPPVVTLTTFKTHWQRADFSFKGWDHCSTSLFWHLSDFWFHWWALSWNFVVTNVPRVFVFYICVAGALFLTAYSGVIFLLGSYAVAAVTSAMQASSVAALIGSKVATQRLIELSVSVSDVCLSFFY